MAMRGRSRHVARPHITTLAEAPPQPQCRFAPGDNTPKCDVFGEKGGGHRRRASGQSHLEPGVNVVTRRSLRVSQGRIF